MSYQAVDPWPQTAGSTRAIDKIVSHNPLEPGVHTQLARPVVELDEAIDRGRSGEGHRVCGVHPTGRVGEEMVAALS